jgi:hypothetical protein
MCVIYHWFFNKKYIFLDNSGFSGNNNLIKSGTGDKEL